MVKLNQREIKLGFQYDSKKPKTKNQKCAINKDRTRKSHMESLFFLIFSCSLFFPHEFPVQATTSFKNLGQAEK